MNRLRDQAHQPNAAATVDKIDPPRYLQNFQRGQKEPRGILP
jgi:hypothetical protein